jgi:hypothetical protein
MGFVGSARLIQLQHLAILLTGFVTAAYGKDGSGVTRYLGSLDLDLFKYHQSAAVL